MKVDARLNTGVLTNRSEHHVSQHSLLRRPILDLAAINFDAIRKLSRLRKLPLKSCNLLFAIAVARSHPSPCHIDLPDHVIVICPISLPRYLITWATCR